VEETRQKLTHTNTTHTHTPTDTHTHIMVAAVQQAGSSGAVPHGALPRLGAIKEKKGLSDLRTASAGPKLDIIDIRHAAVEINLKAEVLSLFHTRDAPRMLPTLLLYDERGLQLFEKARPPCPLAALSLPTHAAAAAAAPSHAPHANLVPDHIPRRVLLDQ